MMIAKPNNKPRTKGANAEQAAAAYLKRKGWRILDMNYHTRRGEIDIIGRDGDQLVFIEIKSSSSPAGWDLGDRIDRRKRKKIALTATEYISRHEIPAGGIRFDAILMTAAKFGEWTINHIKDAFRMDDTYI